MNKKGNKVYVRLMKLPPNKRIHFKKINLCKKKAHNYGNCQLNSKLLTSIKFLASYKLHCKILILRIESHHCCFNFILHI